MKSVEVISLSGLGFNGVVIDLQHHFMICLNFRNVYNFRTEIYDIVVDFEQLRAVESRSCVPCSCATEEMVNLNGTAPFHRLWLRMPGGSQGGPGHRFLRAAGEWAEVY